eukprot:Cvel_33451.t1-p1 / transcript=Cvel_33451.t1 / gene=Cvel_33451 / organism=Chromera_velia_CCMP2878 / gene_product=TNF receptor-associated factor 4, putative / transcript_product=TNF receptor-associated factor 4, putative / location=Cvel_scaffold5437:3555-4100(+) / protein_length=182 / sequence_SO=supercontig / SO=protein_coding / is_pseudo=false
MKRGGLGIHTQICRHRLVACEHCRMNLPLSLKKNHIARCLKAPAKCPSLCGAQLPKTDLCMHLETQRPEALVSCPVSGCGERLKRKCMEEHDGKSWKKHISLLTREFNRFRDKADELSNGRFGPFSSGLPTRSDVLIMKLLSPPLLLLRSDSLEVTVRLPDFVAKAAEKEPDQIRSLPFEFQ